MAKLKQKTSANAIPERRVMKLVDLNPAPDNPRTISEEAFRGLAKSIEQFGLVQSIVYNARSRNIVGGHQKLRVLKSMGVTETEVAVVDLSEQDERTLNIALNNPLIAGKFTEDVLPSIDEILNEVPHLAIDLRLPELALDVETAFYEKPEDEVPSPPALEPLTKRDEPQSVQIRCPECGAQFPIEEGVG